MIDRINEQLGKIRGIWAFLIVFVFFLAGAALTHLAAVNLIFGEHTSAIVLCIAGIVYMWSAMHIKLPNTWWNK